MTLEEFVGLDPNKIRRDKELMQLYIKFYEAAFFVIPNCAGCSFKGGFKKLKQYSISGTKNINFEKNIIEMKNPKTFLLKKQHLTKILTYKVEGRTHRKYGNQLTNEFALELVKDGQSDLFHKLPEGSKFYVEMHLKDGTVETYGKEHGLETPHEDSDNLIDNLSKEGTKFYEDGKEIKLWDKIPKSENEATVSKDVILVNVNDIDRPSRYFEMDYHKEILPLYAEARERTGKQADSRKQQDIIKFLQANES